MTSQSKHLSPANLECYSIDRIWLTAFTASCVISLDGMGALLYWLTHTRIAQWPSLSYCIGNLHIVLIPMPALLFVFQSAFDRLDGIYRFIIMYLLLTMTIAGKLHLLGIWLNWTEFQKLIL